MDFQGTKAWRILVSVSLVFLIFAVITELFMMDWLSSYISVQNLEQFTLVFTFVLMADIYFSFLKSTDRKAFLKKNALKILVILPWGTIFRALSFIRLDGLVAEIPVLADLFAMEKAGSAASKTILIAEKSKRLAEL
jgi:hypothetical protein